MVLSIHLDFRNRRTKKQEKRKLLAGNSEEGKLEHESLILAQDERWRRA